MAFVRIRDVDDVEHIINTEHVIRAERHSKGHWRVWLTPRENDEKHKIDTYQVPIPAHPQGGSTIWDG